MLPFHLAQPDSPPSGRVLGKFYQPQQLLAFTAGTAVE